MHSSLEASSWSFIWKENYFVIFAQQMSHLAFSWRILFRKLPRDALLVRSLL